MMSQLSTVATVKLPKSIHTCVETRIIDPLFQPCQPAHRYQDPCTEHHHVAKLEHPDSGRRRPLVKRVLRQDRQAAKDRG